MIVLRNKQFANVTKALANVNVNARGMIKSYLPKVGTSLDSLNQRQINAIFTDMNKVPQKAKFGKVSNYLDNLNTRKSPWIR